MKECGSLEEKKEMSCKQVRGKGVGVVAYVLAEYDVWMKQNRT